MLILSLFNVQSLWPIALLFGVAVVIPIIISVFKLKIIPSLVLEIIAGVILALIPQTREMFVNHEMKMLPIPSGFYVLGMSILLFLSGLDTDFSVFHRRMKDKNKTLPELEFAIIAFIIVVLLSVGISFAFSHHIVGDKVAGIALLTITISSTFASLVIPLIHDANLHETTIGKIISTYATIAELVSIIALSVMLVLLGKGNKYISIILMLISVCLVILNIFLRYFKVGKLFEKVSDGIVHLTLRFITFVLLVCILLADLAGVEYILGAFLAGMVISATHPTHSEKAKLEQIGYGIFAPLFYILAGFTVGKSLIRIGLTNFFSPHNLMLIFLASASLLITRIPFMYLTKYYHKATTIPTMFITSSTIIVPLALEHINGFAEIFSEELIVAFIIASLLSVIIPPILFANGPKFGDAKDNYHQEIIERCDIE